MADVIHTNAAQIIIREAADASKERASKSYIINPKKYQSIPRISHEGIVLGEHLASGSFNDVYEVKEIRPGNTHHQLSDSDENVAVCPSESAAG
eukprot:12881641-Ditylum_brightwellii.AAC.1